MDEGVTIGIITFSKKRDARKIKACGMWREKNEIPFAYFISSFGSIYDSNYKQLNKGSELKWKKGDEIGMKIDLSKWNISFYNNNKMIGVYRIEKNIIYYPGMMHCGCEETDLQFSLSTFSV